MRVCGSLLHFLHTTKTICFSPSPASFLQTTVSFPSHSNLPSSPDLMQIKFPFPLSSLCLRFWRLCFSDWREGGKGVEKNSSWSGREDDLREESMNEWEMKKREHRLEKWQRRGREEARQESKRGTWYPRTKDLQKKLNRSHKSLFLPVTFRKTVRHPTDSLFLPRWSVTESSDAIKLVDVFLSYCPCLQVSLVKTTDPHRKNPISHGRDNLFRRIPLSRYALLW